MKKSKRYIKKQNNKPLINKKVLAKVIRESNICKHAIKELKFTDDEWCQISPDGTCQNNRFRTTKNTEAIIFENGGFVGNLGLSKKTMEKVY